MKNKLIYILNSNYFTYAILFLFILPSVAWIFLDNHVWPWDQAWYGEVSVDLYYKLAHSFSEWPKAMMSAFGVKAPAIAWLGQFFVPLAKITGSVDRALLFSIILAQFFALLFIYKIVFLLTNQKTIALLGSLIMASAPLFIGMGHQYFVESLQLLAVIFIIFIAFSARRWNRYKIILALMFAIPFAMIIKITSPLYLLLPGLMIIWFLLKNPIKITAKEYFREKKNIVFYLLASGFIYLVASWYLINWDSIYQFMQQASSGSVAELYGTRDSFFSKLDLWLLFFRKSFFMPTTMYITFLIISVYLFQYVFLKEHKLKEFAMFISIPSIALVLILFAFQINEETRYLLPILPYVTILMGWLLHEIRSRWIIVMTVIIFGFQFIFVHGVTLGLLKNRGNNISTWSTVVHIDTLQKADMIGIIKQTCNLENANKINVVGVEFPWLNANSAEYYATQKKLTSNFKCYYTSLGYAESNTDKAINRVKNLIKPPYFITVSGDSFPAVDAFNAVSISVAEYIENDKSFVEQKFSQSKSVRIFKNIAR